MRLDATVREAAFRRSQEKTFEAIWETIVYETTFGCVQKKIQMHLNAFSIRSALRRGSNTFLAASRRGQILNRVYTRSRLVFQMRLYSDNMLHRKLNECARKFTHVKRCMFAKGLHQRRNLGQKLHQMCLKSLTINSQSCISNTKHILCGKINRLHH